jgi:hypothetical protein
MSTGCEGRTLRVTGDGFVLSLAVGIVVAGAERR